MGFKTKFMTYFEQNTCWWFYRMPGVIHCAFYSCSYSKADFYKSILYKGVSSYSIPATTRSPAHTIICGTRHRTRAQM